MRSHLILLLVASATVSGCTISVKRGFGTPQALILKPGLKHGIDAFYWPTNGDKIQMNDGDVAVFACPGSNLIIKGTPVKNMQADAKCWRNSFIILRISVAFIDIKCATTIANVARYTGRTCLKKHKEVEAGFELDGGRFLRQITMCFDSVKQDTLYSECNLTRYIDMSQSGYPRAHFSQADFYNVGMTSLDDLYSRNCQRKTINALLGLPPNATNYITEVGDKFLSRGHLTANADFVYGPQQSVSFYYVNVAPQWQTLNGYNWNILERDVRDFTSSRNLDLVVYTGVHGVLTLPHYITGAPTPLYLNVNQNVKALTVPRVFWKVLYNRKTKAGVAFVGVNNPYNGNIIDDIFCKDICSRIKWLTWSRTNVAKGYGYCCDVNDLRKTVTNIPQFDVTSVLV